MSITGKLKIMPSIPTVEQEIESLKKRLEGAFKVCPKCKGTGNGAPWYQYGRICSYDDCDACNGKGKIPA